MGPGFESQPVHKACHESDRLFCFKDVSKACFRKRTRSKKGNETRSGSFTPPNNRGKFWVRTPFRDVGEVKCSRQSQTKTISLTKCLFLKFPRHLMKLEYSLFHLFDLKKLLLKKVYFVILHF